MLLKLSPGGWEALILDLPSVGAQGATPEPRCFTNPESFQRSHHVRRNVGIGVHLLHIIALFEHIDEAHHPLGKVCIAGDGGIGHHGDFTAGRFDASGIDGVLDVDE